MAIVHLNTWLAFSLRVLVKQKVVRKLATVLGDIPLHTPVVLAVPLDKISPNRLDAIGFSQPAMVGDQVLPSRHLGPASRFNAEGKEIVRDDRPMEIVYAEVPWKRMEWHGPDRVEVEEVAYRPYKRYPRELIKPPGVELQVTEAAGTRYVVAATPLQYHPANDDLLHALNLMLEAFGSCLILTNRYDQIVTRAVRRLNWRILPVGGKPWEAVEPLIQRLLRDRESLDRLVVEMRFKTITRHMPARVFVGRGGFRGYLAFEFPNKGLVVLESTFTQNATYVFGMDWEQIISRSKAEILHGSLHKKRIIHRRPWKYEISRLLQAGRQ